MNPLFAVNFRREVYQREQARARARVVLLGVWVAYFGVIGIVLGLYGLNAAAYARRTAMLERQARRAQETHGLVDWTLSADDVNGLTARVENLAVHHDVVERIGARLPANVRLERLAWNSERSSGATAKKLVLAGTLRPEGGDRMSQVVRLVSALSADSAFARRFRNVKLASTTVDDQSGVLEFTIECQ